MDVLDIKKEMIDKKIRFYVGGDRVYCQADNGDTIQVLDIEDTLKERYLKGFNEGVYMLNDKIQQCLKDIES